MEGFFSSAPPGQESGSSGHTHSGIADNDALNDILTSGRMTLPSASVPKPVTGSKSWQGRPVRRRAQLILDRLFSELRPAHGVHTHDEVVRTLRTSLCMVDPAFARAQQAVHVVDALRTGLAKQTRDQTSRGITRAISDLVSDGSGIGTYSVSAARQLLGISVSRKRAGQPSSSTADSFGKQRKKHKQAFAIEVKKAVEEFAFAYCKYEEKQYVSVLPAIHVWDIYCVHHDREGSFYAMGKKLNRLSYVCTLLTLLVALPLRLLIIRQPRLPEVASCEGAGSTRQQTI